MPPSSVPDSTAAAKPAGHARATQAERLPRAALLESAARGLSRYGDGNLVLKQGARDAGLTRGLGATIPTGECERIGEDIAGLAVHIGARIGSLAGPSEVLVSGAVCDLVMGSGLEFAAGGAHELTGGARPLAALLAGR